MYLRVESQVFMPLVISFSPLTSRTYDEAMNRYLSYGLAEGLGEPGKADSIWSSMRSTRIFSLGSSHQISGPILNLHWLYRKTPIGESSIGSPVVSIPHPRVILCTKHCLLTPQAPLCLSSFIYVLNVSTKLE